MARLSLHWPVDVGGYHIKPAPTGGTSRAAKTIIGSANPGPSIVRDGGKLNYDRDSMKIDGLYPRLADCPPTPQGALDFIRKYGFLNGKRSELVEFICHEIKVVRSLLAVKKSGDWEKLYLWMIDNPKASRLKPVLLGGDPPQLFFQPTTLLDAIYLQFFEDMSGGANLKFCKRPGCGEWFRYGPGTLHRATAQFCSPKCQKADDYQKRKGANT